MVLVLALSALAAVWWVLSLFFLPKLFKKRTDWQRRAHHKFGRAIIMAGFLIYLSGGECNIIASLANGSWKMPVAEFDTDGNIAYPKDFEECEKEHNFLHTCMKPDTRFPLLVDRIPVHPIGYILSIGDFLLIAGTALMTLQRIWIFFPTKRPH